MMTDEQLDEMVSIAVQSTSNAMAILPRHEATSEIFAVQFMLWGFQNEDKGRSATVTDPKIRKSLLEYAMYQVQEWRDGQASIRNTLTAWSIVLQELQHRLRHTAKLSDPQAATHQPL